MTYAQTLVALADPTRRAMYEALRQQPLTVGDLAARVRIRQPTASQHLQMLRRAALVVDRRDGTRRYYRASREGLDALRRYVESLWDDVLAAYASSDRDAPKKPTSPRRRRESRQ